MKDSSPFFVSVVIPVRNERETIGPLLKELKAILGSSVQMVVVDDGSTDGSGEAASQAGALVLRQPHSMGNGAAIKRGIRAAGADRILLLDGDGQHDPKEIPKLLAQAHQYDLVVGARAFWNQANLARAAANWVFNRLASYVAEQPVKDLTSGFRLLKRADVFRFLSLLPNRFSYPTTMTLAYLRCGYSVGYVPITLRRRRGVSKVVWWEDGVRFFLIILKVATLTSPLKVFLPIAGGFLGLGAGYYGYTFSTAHRFTNMSALLISTGVLVFLMGLLAEAIAELRFERIES